MRVLYIDEFLIINAAANYLMLLAAAVICGVYAPRWRLAVSAAMGALYAAAAVLAGGFWQSLAVKAAVSAAMVLFSFYRSAHLARLYLACLLCALLLGGTTCALQLLLARPGGRATRLWVLLAAFPAAYAVLRVVLGNAGRCHSGGGIVRTELTLLGQTAVFNALVDTGNSLSDPVTGKKVMVVEYGALQKLNALSGLDEALLRQPASAPEKWQRLPVKTRLRLVPYSSVGQERGLLLAVRPDEIKVDGKMRKDLLVALSPSPLSDGGGYSALIGVN